MRGSVVLITQCTVLLLACSVQHFDDTGLWWQNLDLLGRLFLTVIVIIVKANIGIVVVSIVKRVVVVVERLHHLILGSDGTGGHDGALEEFHVLG